MRLKHSQRDQATFFRLTGEVRLAPAEQLFILRDADAKILVLQEAFAAVLQPLLAVLPKVAIIGLGHTPAAGASFDNLLQSGAGPLPAAQSTTDNPLLIGYTSGTTGRPKGAVLQQQALIANAAMSHHAHDMTSADHVLTVLPLFHVGGLNIQTTPALQIGATVTLQDRFTPAATLNAIAHDRPTLLVMVPATMQAMIEHPSWLSTPLDSLRAVAAGSTIVPQSLIDPFTARGVPVLQIYGATETAPIAIYTRTSGDWRRAGSTGLPGLLCDARVVDDHRREVPHGLAGEVEVKGANVLSEYWRNPVATAEALVDGWFRTGDIATRDADGYFTIHDRKQNLIISGGENIYPAEVERVLLSHPAIAEAAVIAAPDARWQEVPVGCIVVRTGSQVSAEEIEAFCLVELARFKVPRRYVFLDTLPRNVMGKVQHFLLQKRHGGAG